ncbi:MAG: endopeptidase La, partial [Alphaproteobacteria bacterium]|nr:endopeptidase La [Alphaproteobacteria bacterium]
GLAWTEVGGELLQIESAVMAGKGLAVFTGKLGDVMKESIETAKSFVRSHSAQFGINSKIWDKIDIHIHVPEGATPKDGPSAGIAMMTSIVSTLTEIPVKKDVAMTGEITLRGRVLPIGGLKEKLLAALRGGIKTVAIPFENLKDLEEIPQVVKDGLKIIPVKTADEVLKIALSKPLQPIKEVGDFFENLLKTPTKPQGEIVQ